MTVPDGYNLPPGLAPSGLPGNSRREIAVERAMEEALDMGMDVCDTLETVVEVVGAAFEDSAEDAQLTIKKAQRTLEMVQAKLDDTLDILGRVCQE